MCAIFLIIYLTNQMLRYIYFLTLLITKPDFLFIFRFQMTHKKMKAELIFEGRCYFHAQKRFVCTMLPAYVEKCCKNIQTHPQT